MSAMKNPITLKKRYRVGLDLFSCILEFCDSCARKLEQIGALQV